MDAPSENPFEAPQSELARPRKSGWRLVLGWLLMLLGAWICVCLLPLAAMLGWKMIVGHVLDGFIAEMGCHPGLAGLARKLVVPLRSPAAVVTQSHGVLASFAQKSCLARP